MKLFLSVNANYAIIGNLLRINRSIIGSELFRNVKTPNIIFSDSV